MARAKEKPKERFVGIPYRVANSAQFAALSAHDVKLLVDLLVQYSGYNNGALSPTHSLMKKRGWAKSSLYRAFVSCEEKGFVVVTRKGWKQRGKPTLVALTWLGIHEVRGIEYDEGVEPSDKPLGYWCMDSRLWRHQPTMRKQVKRAPGVPVAKNALHIGADNVLPVPLLN